MLETSGLPEYDGIEVVAVRLCDCVTAGANLVVVEVLEIVWAWVEVEVWEGRA